jgi:hypothetical protein
MNDFIAGPASGTRERGTGTGPGGGGGAPPPVLIAALGAAALIAATLVALLLSSGGGDSVPAGAGVDDPRTPATTSTDGKRVLLTVQIEGGGSGRVLIDPRGVSCTETCEHDFASGTRVSVTANAAKGSRFDGWSDACTRNRCSLVMDRARTVTAAFEARPTVSQCEDGRDNDGDGSVDASDPGCGADDTEAPDDRPQAASDCQDGRDNDGDGLVDTAQDPGCAADGTEADTATPKTTPNPPPTSPSECTDGRDNDGDGLVDRAQDPGCRTGSTEGATQSPSECRDGRDNDGDGLVDRPTDPGCDADGSEAGGP